MTQDAQNVSYDSCVAHKQKGDSRGYGSTQRKVFGKWRCVHLHRVAYVNANGLTLEDIEGLVVRHTCDNPRCINPAHLVLGTHADNMRDKAERCTAIHGENNAHAKLTNADVAEIRRRHIPGCRTNGARALAREFGVASQTVDKLLRGETW